MKDYRFCGLEGIWTTGKADPMWAACKVHDLGYEAHMRGEDVGGSSWEVDKKFWSNMGRLIAKEKRWWMKGFMWGQRLVYFPIVRIVGVFRWSRIKGTNA